MHRIWDVLQLISSNHNLNISSNLIEFPEAPSQIKIWFTLTESERESEGDTGLFFSNVWLFLCLIAPKKGYFLFLRTSTPSGMNCNIETTTRSHIIATSLLPSPFSQREQSL